MREHGDYLHNHTINLPTDASKDINHTPVWCLLTLVPALCKDTPTQICLSCHRSTLWCRAWSQSHPLDPDNPPPVKHVGFLSHKSNWYEQMKLVHRDQHLYDTPGITSTSADQCLWWHHKDPVPALVHSLLLQYYYVDYSLMILKCGITSCICIVIP